MTGNSSRTKIKSFRNLIVWQKTFDLAKDVYVLSGQLPRDEKFGLSSQIQRCAISIPSNIAEGQQRNNVKEYRQFLGVARGSAAELETQLLLIQDIYKIDTASIVSNIEEIQKILYAIIKKL